MRLWWGTTISMEMILKWNAPLGQGQWWLSRKWHTSSTRGSSRYSCLMSTISAHVMVSSTIQWYHNKRDGVSNHQPHNRLYRRRSRKTSKLRASNAEKVSIWWRHRDVVDYTTRIQNIVERWRVELFGGRHLLLNIFTLYDLLTLISAREMKFVLV